MPSFQLAIDPTLAKGVRFLTQVRDQLKKALQEEFAARGVSQAEVARIIGVNRSVINRQLIGLDNLTVRRAGEIAAALGRVPRFTCEPENVANGSNDLARFSKVEDPSPSIANLPPASTSVAFG